MKTFISVKTHEKNDGKNIGGKISVNRKKYW
jgi:hypothetical protein